jgi:hypothetical protein
LSSSSILELVTRAVRGEIAQYVKWLATGWLAGFDSRQGRIFSLCRFVHTDSGAHQVTYPVGSIPRDLNCPVLRVDHSFRLKLHPVSRLRLTAVLYIHSRLWRVA